MDDSKSFEISQGEISEILNKIQQNFAVLCCDEDRSPEKMTCFNGVLESCHRHETILALKFRIEKSLRSKLSVLFFKIKLQNSIHTGLVVFHNQPEKSCVCVCFF